MINGKRIRTTSVPGRADPARLAVTSQPSLSSFQAHKRGDGSLAPRKFELPPAALRQTGAMTNTEPRVTADNGTEQAAAETAETNLMEPYDSQVFRAIRYELAADGRTFNSAEVSLRIQQIVMASRTYSWLVSRDYETGGGQESGDFSTPLRGSASGSPVPGENDDKDKDSLFGSKMSARLDGASSSRKKYFSNIELHHRVQGVLNKVTADESKYRDVRNELLMLPISAAQVESLAKVVGVFFVKAVKEPHFSSLYAKLVGEICKVTKRDITGDVKESTPHKLRQALLTRCQQEFEKPLEAPASEIMDLDSDDRIEYETQRRKDQISNIKFVAELFNLKLLTPFICQRILLKLMFGLPQNNTVPQEFDYSRLDMYEASDVELDLVKAFLGTCGNFLLEQPVGKLIVPEVVRRAKIFSETHKVARTRFAMMDMIDMARRNFIPKEKKFITEQDYEREKLESKLKIDEAIGANAHGKQIRLAPPRDVSGSNPPPPPQYGSETTPNREAGNTWGRSPIINSTPNRGPVRTGGSPPPPPYAASPAPTKVQARDEKQDQSPPPAVLVKDVTPSKSSPDLQPVKKQESPPLQEKEQPVPPIPPPPVSREVVGQMMADLNQTKDFDQVARSILRYTTDDQFSEVLSVWVHRCLTTARCEPDRMALPQLLNSVAELKASSSSARSETPQQEESRSLESFIAKIQGIVLKVIDEMIKTKYWESAPKIWKFWAQIVGAGSFQSAPEDILLGETIRVNPTKKDKAAPRDMKVLHQGLHNIVLKKLLDSMNSGRLTAPDVKLFITQVMSFNNSPANSTISSGTAKGVTSVWYYLDPAADFSRFRPLAVCANAERDSNEARLALYDSFFSDETLKKEDVEYMLYWWCRQDRSKPDAETKLSQIFEKLRKHPQSLSSAVVVAKIAGAIRACGAICGEDLFDHFVRILHVTVDGADRAVRELYILVELYHTGLHLDFLVPASLGFNTTKQLKKGGIIADETFARCKNLFGHRNEFLNLLGIK